jgi:putative transcriptional regulator
LKKRQPKIAIDSLSGSLSNHFLIAMPGMADPYFAKTLTLICEHSDKGAIGVVVNKPIDLTLASLFGEINIALEDAALRETNVLFGGPVLMDRGFVLHQPLGEWSSTLKIDDELGLTTSKDILEAIAAGTGPSRVLVTLGYAGWGPGQLEDEVARNGWLSVDANADVVFTLPPAERLAAAMALLGLNYGNLSDVAGHA